MLPLRKIWLTKIFFIYSYIFFLFFCDNLCSIFFFQRIMGSEDLELEEEERVTSKSIKLPVTIDVALRNIKDAKVI